MEKEELEGKVVRMGEELHATRLQLHQKEQEGLSMANDLHKHKLHSGSLKKQ